MGFLPPTLCCLFFNLILVLITTKTAPTTANIQTSKSQLTNSKLNPKMGPKKWPTMDGERPLIFGHRGDSVVAPEHTLFGYELAAIFGADYIEPDLVLTKDNQFICFHDLYLCGITDVASHSEFDERKIQMMDGTFKWAIKDFTLAEIKGLRLRQKNVGVRPQDLNGVFGIPTFQEFLERIHQLSFKLNRTIGILPELKEPTYHNKNQVPNFMENLLLTTLRKNGYSVTSNQTENCTTISNSISRKIKCPHVIIQSFELPALEYVKQNSYFDLLMLVWSDSTFLTHEGVKEIAKTAKYYSIWKTFLFIKASLIFHRNNKSIDHQEIRDLGGFIPPKEFPSFAHSQGLKFVVYSVYDSREPSKLDGIDTIKTKRDELNYYFNLGVDAIFVENVAESIEIRNEAQLRVEIGFKAQSGSKSGPKYSKNSGSSGRISGMEWRLYQLTICALSLVSLSFFGMN